ncbi:MAG: hypothetical protein ACI8T1_002858 [Verrucomicrobiales bacterium]|jgi:hypothetical protein
MSFRGISEEELISITWSRHAGRATIGKLVLRWLSSASMTHVIVLLRKGSGMA